MQRSERVFFYGVYSHLLINIINISPIEERSRISHRDKATLYRAKGRRASEPKNQRHRPTYNECTGSG